MAYVAELSSQKAELVQQNNQKQNGIGYNMFFFMGENKYEKKKK